jgi:hypothetical protein
MFRGRAYVRVRVVRGGRERALDSRPTSAGGHDAATDPPARATRGRLPSARAPPDHRRAGQ